MKIRFLIIVGISISVGVILLSSFSIQKDEQAYVLFCNHWIFSDRITCDVLWSESDRNTPVMKYDISEEPWENLLSHPREESLKELQKIFDENGKFFMDVKIIGLKDYYVLGEKLAFTVVEAGYGIPCTHPKIMVSRDGDDKPHWDYNFVHSCPFFKEGHPILSYVNVPHNNRVMPPITESGQYTITASSSYDSFTSRQFAVLESDFVYDYDISYTKSGNNTGYTSLNIDLNNGNYVLDQNSKLTRDVLFDEELEELKQLVDENDLLRGLSSVSHDRDPACKTCINYEMRISLGDYTHFVQWQNDKDRLREKHIFVIEMLEELLETMGGRK
ncbi:MAG: hypothetical protein K5790_01540 [Nitrosopumilus sp.]|uniref:hypothetical protein n=1 Tax=Nitrosopumilus sp. TaxID=2024843 RepID=UPI00247B8F76|nr:hypothetical protein [Nitrosopumilus sp.]MCV0391957.1 hypothetical protein [Nitrosopumilus sp.]